MSDIPFTILIGSAGNGPDGYRTFMPLSVARYWIDDAEWTFHDLDDPESGVGRVRPSDAGSQVAALVAGIAAYLVGDPDVFDALEALAPGDDDDPVIDRDANGVLVETARTSIEDLVRLTVITELPIDGGHLVAHPDLGDIDAELVLVPIH